MNFFSFTIAIIVAALIPSISFADTRTIVFNWTMEDTTGVTGYKLYYGYNDNMTINDGALHTNCTPPTSQPSATNPDELDFSMTCNDIVIDQYPVYFRIAAVTEEEEVPSDIFAITAPISQVKNFIILTPSASPPPPQGQIYAINFQPADAPVPEGYSVDSGAAFDETRGYGWTVAPNSYGARDRDNDASPSQEYDTMIHVAPTAAWEAAIANGTYRVTICMGDPSYPGGTPDVQAEGTTIISGQTLSTDNMWIEQTGDIQVSDGRLTITFTGSTDPARICWIKVDAP